MTNYNKSLFDIVNKSKKRAAASVNVSDKYKLLTKKIICKVDNDSKRPSFIFIGTGSSADSTSPSRIIAYDNNCSQFHKLINIEAGSTIEICNFMKNAGVVNIQANTIIDVITLPEVTDATVDIEPIALSEIIKGKSGSVWLTEPVKVISINPSNQGMRAACRHCSYPVEHDMENCPSCTVDDYKPVLSAMIIISNNRDCTIKAFMDLGGCLRIVGHTEEEFMESIAQDRDIHSYFDNIDDQKEWHLLISKRGASKQNTEDNHYSVDGVFALDQILPRPSKKVKVRK